MVVVGLHVHKHKEGRGLGAEKPNSSHRGSVSGVPCQRRWRVVAGGDWVAHTMQQQFQGVAFSNVRREGAWGRKPKYEPLWLSFGLY